MTVFRADGHLTDEALASLAANGDLSELHRLEIAEHLAFCDLCLQRYTDAMAGDALLIPEHSCRDNIWRRIRTKTMRILTSRYATAAAAMALALILVWGLPPMERIALPEDNAVTQRLENWPERWNESLSGLIQKFNDLFDGLDRPAEYGGITK